MKYKTSFFCSEFSTLICAKNKYHLDKAIALLYDGTKNPERMMRAVDINFPMGAICFSIRTKKKEKKKALLLYCM
jgi:hypothetical protein